MVLGGQVGPRLVDDLVRHPLQSVPVAVLGPPPAGHVVPLAGDGQAELVRQQLHQVQLRGHLALILVQKGIEDARQRARVLVAQLHEDLGGELVGLPAQQLHDHAVVDLGALVLLARGLPGLQQHGGLLGAQGAGWRPGVGPAALQALDPLQRADGLAEKGADDQGLHAVLGAAVALGDVGHPRLELMHVAQAGDHRRGPGLVHPRHDPGKLGQGELRRQLCQPRAPDLAGALGLQGPVDFSR